MRAPLCGMKNRERSQYVSVNQPGSPGSRSSSASSRSASASTALGVRLDVAAREREREGVVVVGAHDGSRRASARARHATCRRTGRARSCGVPKPLDGLEDRPQQQPLAAEVLDHRHASSAAATMRSWSNASGGSASRRVPGRLVGVVPAADRRARARPPSSTRNATPTVQPRGSRPGSPNVPTWRNGRVGVRPGLLGQLAPRGVLERLVLVDESARQRPAARERFLPSTDEEQLRACGGPRRATASTVRAGLGYS